MDHFLLPGDIPAHHSAARPEAVAVHFGGRDCTWRELERRTDAAARSLRAEWGVAAGDRVAYLGLNRLDQLVLLFALCRLGAMLVPLNVRLAPIEWQAVLDDCTPVCVLHDSAFCEPASALAAMTGRPAFPIEALVKETGTAGAPAAGVANAPALLVYTSGTTGRPKGAVHTQANLVANMAAAIRAHNLTSQDRVLTVLPLFHVGGLCIQTLPALRVGATVLLHSRFDATATLQALAERRPTLTLLVPAVMKALLEHPAWQATDLTSLRAVWAGSSILPEVLVQGFHARGVPVCNVYGATETGPFSLALPADRALDHVGSCGWPALAVEVRLADVRTEGVGELWVRAPQVVRHYWPQLPAVDADGWFHSGDLARRAADGSYTIVGRARELIISGGENIYPAEVEHALASHPWVAECAVIGQPDITWGQIPVVFVVLRHQNGLQPPPDGPDPLSNWEQTLRTHLRDRLARYKQPRRWVRLDALPRTALGKVRVSELGAMMTTSGAPVT